MLVREIHNEHLLQIFLPVQIVHGIFHEEADQSQFRLHTTRSMTRSRLLLTEAHWSIQV